MTGFRDDREALLARLDALEREIARGGDAAERAQLRLQVQELVGAVRAATERLDRDRGTLADLGARLDAVRRELAGDVATPSVEGPVPTGPHAPVGSAPTPGIPPWMVGASVLAILVVGGLLLVSSRSETPAPAAARPILDLPGGVHAFDPIAGLEGARRRSPLGAAGQLSAIRARYVARDGRVDLDARSYQGSVEYEFVAPGISEPVDPDTPIGVPRPTALGQIATVRATASGFGFEPGLTTPWVGSPPVPDPRCNLAALWAVAAARGAPPGAVALIEYSHSTGPDQDGQWTFSIADTNTTFQIGDDDCLTASRHPPR